MDDIDLSIPLEFDIQGAKLNSLTQATAYKGIREHEPKRDREAAITNLQRTRMAIRRYSGTREMDETIWQSLRKSVLRTRVKQFLYKTMHEVYMIGPAWKHLPGYEHRQTCVVCNSKDSMEHIPIKCNSPMRQKVWELARQTWPHAPALWPNINLGIILGTGSISLPNRNTAQTNHPTLKERAALRLLQIILSEAAHLTWVLRCERVIQEKTLNEQGITKRWNRAINERLTTDRITAQKTKRNKKFTQLTENHGPCSATPTTLNPNPNINPPKCLRKTIRPLHIGSLS